MNFMSTVKIENVGAEDYFEKAKQNEIDNLQDWINKIIDNTLSDVDKNLLITYLNSQQALIIEKVKIYRSKKNNEEDTVVPKLNDEDLEYGEI